jgi:hypothetical protein
VGAPHERTAGWTIQDAEHLLGSLTGVVSARVVTRPGGEVEEIHILTTKEVSPKQTVRNVESALLAHLDLEVDHRIISVAQSNQVAPVPVDDEAEPMKAAPSRESSRLVFHSHGVETERGRKVRHRVEIGWRKERYTGEASAADLPRSRLEAVAKATLRAVEAALAAVLDDEAKAHVALALDGVRTVDAFERRFILVAVNAMAGRDLLPLAGATVVEESSDRATILATLHATDRWVRGKL